MSKLGIKVSPSKIVCAHLEGDRIDIYKYEVPKVFTYKKREKQKNVTKYHTHKVVAYFTELVANLVKQLDIKMLMVKKSEASNFRRTGVTDGARQHLYVEGAMLSLGSMIGIPCRGCFCQESACVGVNLFDDGLSAVVNHFGLACEDLEYWKDDQHAGDAAFAAILLRSI